VGTAFVDAAQCDALKLKCQFLSVAEIFIAASNNRKA